MKLGQLTDYNKRFFFFKNYAGNDAGREVPGLFLVFKHPQYEVKASGLQLSINIMR